MRLRNAAAAAAAAVFDRSYRLLARIALRLEPYADRYRFPLLAPYAYVQADAIANLSGYLRIEPGQIERIVVVGGWHGDEINEMLERFTEGYIVVLEPSREPFGVLWARHGSNPRVKCLNVAASDYEGTAMFHDMSVAGNGSLLPLAPQGAGVALIDGMYEQDCYDVSTVRLDRLPELAESARIDCLWIDVQGFEGAVLDGAEGIMPLVQAAFIEVATDGVTYAGATTFNELAGRMSRHGFRLASLGTNPISGQGNALWVRA